MINKLEINNFKSIKNISLESKRINVFIGEPNVGKSNILESLGLLSLLYYGAIAGTSIKAFIRMTDFTTIFYERNIDAPITVSFDGTILALSFSNNAYQASIGNSWVATFSRAGDFTPISQGQELSSFRFYRFDEKANFQVSNVPEFLLPPSGVNLVGVLLRSRELRRMVSEVFGRFGLKLVIDSQSYEMTLQKEEEGIAISYPFILVSDTLRRLAFYLSAIKTAKDSVLILEEPEAHAFPYYTRYLGELIAADKSNQYFISTHNPYFLLPIVEKASANETAIYRVYYEDYQTKVNKLKHEDVLDLGSDVFLNLRELTA